MVLVLEAEEKAALYPWASTTSVSKYQQNLLPFQPEAPPPPIPPDAAAVDRNELKEHFIKWVNKACQNS